MATTCIGGYSLLTTCLSNKPPIPSKPNASLSSTLKPLLGKIIPEIRIPIDIPKMMKQTSITLLDAFVDQMFEFVDQPYFQSQSNFYPVEELGEAVRVNSIHGTIPHDFPEGVYLRNGSNWIHGGLISTESIFGKSSEVWVEGEGMLHAVYFTKDAATGKLVASYNNRYVETETLKRERERNRPTLLPAVEGHSAAVLMGLVLNTLRYGRLTKDYCNTSVFEHSGKYYAIAENDVPKEIDIHTLETRGLWDDVDRAWNRVFTSHPKRAPETGELVTMGSTGFKPFMVVGVVSADSTKIVHKVDLKFDRGIYSHDIGVTMRYNVILDFPTTVDPTRLMKGGPLIKFEKERYARIGVMPRYGNANSVIWFAVASCCTLHLINCYEEGDEVVVMGCRGEDSILPGPELGINKFEWFSRGFKRRSCSVNGNGNLNSDEGFLFNRPYEWRLNMRTGETEERFLTGDEYAQDFPFINEKFTGLRNKYGYTQVVDSDESSHSAIVKYKGLAKINLEEKDSEGLNKVEYHLFPENTFCTGSVFAAKPGATGEDDGWAVTFVHNEMTNISEAYIIDAKDFSSEAVARITLPTRVPYGFHGAFMPLLSDRKIPNKSLFDVRGL